MSVETGSNGPCLPHAQSSGEITVNDPSACHNPAVSEKNEQETKEYEGGAAPTTPTTDYPDGGLRAWLIVFGVSFATVYATRHDAQFRYHRRCAPLFQRTQCFEISIGQALSPFLHTTYLIFQTCHLTQVLPIFNRFGYVNSWGVSNFILRGEDGI